MNIWLASLRQGWSDRLAFRLLILLSMALLPLGAIAIHATAELQRAAQRAGERGLITLARDAVAGERALIETAIASARALEAFVIERRDDPEACSDLLRSYVERSNIYRFVGFIDADGSMTCVSQGAGLDFGDTEDFARLRSTPVTTITANPAGQATGLPVIIVTRPVYVDYSLAGFMSISIAQRSLELMAQRVIEDAPSVSVLINDRGAVLDRDGASPDLDALPPPETLARLVETRGSRVLRDTSRAGEPAIYALAEVIPGRLYALSTWDRAAPGLRSLDKSPLPLLFPAAMWLACLAVVLLAVNYLVLRHLKGLNSQVRRFALGQREDWPNLPGHAPSEIRELHRTFRNMARLIARDEEEREQALAEKTMLLKEIHHRVKNNLQLIASVINLQMRQIDDPAARRVLQNVQERVLSLASVHRALYGVDSLAHVRADEVIRELLGRIATIGAVPGKPPELRLNLMPMTLDADHMVPLSFLLHEAVTNALKHRAGGSGNPWIAVDLLHEPAEAAPDGGESAPGGTVLLRLRNPLDAPSGNTPSGMAGNAPATSGDGLGAELIEAFAMQLGGDCRQEEISTDDGRIVWELELRFPAPQDIAPGLPRTDSTQPVSA